VIVSTENVPVPFSVEGAHMLQHAKWLLEETEDGEDGSSLVAIDKRYDKLLTGLRTAVANEYKLDKEATSYNDILDAFRLALTFYKRSNDTNGWLAVTAGPLEYLDNTIKTIKDIANRANKDPNNFKVILLAHLNIASDSKSQSTTTNEGQRFPFTGTIDQIGNDIKKVKRMDIDHIVFGYVFIPIGRDVDKMIDMTKQLAKFAR